MCCGSFESNLVHHKVIGHCQYTKPRQRGLQISQLSTFQCIFHDIPNTVYSLSILLSYDMCSTVTVKGLNGMTYYLGQTYTYCVAERVVLLSPKFKNIIFLTETCANMFCILLRYQYSKTVTYIFFKTVYLYIHNKWAEWKIRRTLLTFGAPVSCRHAPQPIH